MSCPISPYPVYESSNLDTSLVAHIYYFRMAAPPIDATKLLSPPITKVMALKIWKEQILN